MHIAFPILPRKIFRFVTVFLVACGIHSASAQWQDMGSLGGGGIYGLCPMGETLFACSSSGVYASTDSGAHWAPRNNGLTTTNVRAIVAHKSILLVGTLGGGVFASTDKGQSWGSPTLGGRFVQALLSGGDLVFAGTDAGVFRSSDGGTSWTAANAGLTNLTVTSLAASGGRIFAGTYGDGVFVSDDNGLHWQLISVGLNASSIISLVPAGNLLYAGTMGGGVVELTDTTGRWTCQTVGLSGTNVNALLGLQNRILAGTNTSMVHASAAGWIPTNIIQQEVREPTSYNYLLFMPRDLSQEQDGKFPLILFLHGIDALSGTVGGPSNLSLIKKEGLPKILDGNNDFPAIVVSPQCPAETEWYYENIDNNKLINRLLDSAIQRYPVDTNRIIITGLSMGGIGSWYFACHNPTRFSAIAPVAFRGDPAWDVCTIKDSVWAFHGALDGTIPLSKAEAVIDAFTACGGNPRFTVYPNLGHDCWTVTYARQDLYDWMFLQRKR
jgi:poly(3-hydroxybutyrate) depolymerase